MGKFCGTVEVVEDGLVINGKKIKFYAEKDPANLPWAELGVEVVVESTGFYTDAEKAKAHIAAGAKKLSFQLLLKTKTKQSFLALTKNEYDPAKHNVISMASCTTNCLAPVAKVIAEKFGVVKGLMTTVHSYTGDQRILDAGHKRPKKS